jgi:7,8-dihydropterin-6-yl-methyl-4-(beta-D-ribofuranosyl)aminobenzene 5'-phosphate synthase
MAAITILSDNSVARSRPLGLTAEWGFAAAVDDVLFDAGHTGIAARNADLLDCGRRFDTIVLSHGHGDHTGGLPEFLIDEPTVYAHPEVWSPRYNRGEHIGLPVAQTKVEHDADVVEHRDPVEVSPGVWALGEVPREHPDNPSGRRLEDGELVEDHVPDDQSLAIETDDGVALLLGCCHAGLRNTVEHAERVLDDEVCAIVGGTHLTAVDRDSVRETAAWLNDRPALDLVAPGHCTGFDATAVLQSELRDQFQSIGVGSEIEV